MDKYNVFNETKNEWFEIESEWLDSIPTEGIKGLTLFSFGEKLKVEYENGDEIYYSNVHGTWASQLNYHSLILGSRITTNYYLEKKIVIPIRVYIIMYIVIGIIQVIKLYKEV